MLPSFVLLGMGDLVYALPLIIVVSLVYAGTRQEAPELILHHAGRLALMIVGFMLVIFLLLALMSYLT